MIIQIKVPTLPESISDATLISWKKEIGSLVIKGENLIDLETDKVVLEIPAPDSGHLTQIFKNNGATVTGGDLLANFEVTEHTEISNQLETKETQSHLEANELSPAIRRIVFEKQLDIKQIKGTGKHGHLTMHDIQNHLEKNTPPQENKTSMTASPEQTPINKNNQESRPQKRAPMSRLRAKVAERLLQTQQNTATLTTFNEINMANIIDIRNEYKSHFQEQHGVKLGFMSFFIKAATEALKQYPIINASIDDKDIIYHGFYDISVAVSSPRGLIVPVIRDTDQLNFAQIEKEITIFAQQANNSTIAYEDLIGGTFTITNGGTFGSLLSTPLLNPPQSAILGMHTIKERAVVEKGEIVIRPMMNLALSYNHCLIDGRDAVLFLKAIIANLEKPEKLLLNL